tara:strand:+ start:612 stop:944 length:333 start_codon:yes stop_codon:yes gene_type:complete
VCSSSNTQLLSNSALVLGQLVAATAVLDGLGNHFRGDHAGLHGGVVTLDLGEVQGAGVTAHQQAAREGHFRQGLQAALGDGPGAVADALAAFQEFFDFRVGFPALHFIEG